MGMEWHAVTIEIPGWRENLPPKLQQCATWIRRIEDVVVFDKQLHVYACSSTPTYEGWTVECRPVFHPDAPDSVIERVTDCWEMWEVTREVDYYACGPLDVLVAIPEGADGDFRHAVISTELIDQIRDELIDDGEDMRRLGERICQAHQANNFV